MNKKKEKIVENNILHYRSIGEMYVESKITKKEMTDYTKKLFDSMDGEMILEFIYKLKLCYAHISNPLNGLPNMPDDGIEPGVKNIFKTKI